MPRRRRHSSLLLAVSLLAACAEPALAQELPPLIPVPVRSTTLPLEYVADVLVDHERRQVFVSGGSYNSHVVVLDYEGTIVATIEGLPGAGGMVLLRDRIYVMRDGGAGVDIVDPAALEVVDRKRLRHAGTGEVAFAHGHLWHLSGGCGQWASLVGTNVRTWRSHVRPPSFYCPTLESAPANPHLLLSAEDGLSPSQIYRYDISRRPAGFATTGHSANIGGHDVTISSTAQTFLAAKGITREIRLPGMKPTGMTYPTDDHATAVALTDAEGGHVAVGTRPHSTDENLYLFERGSSESVASFILPGGDVLSGTVAFAPEEGRMFASTYDYTTEGENIVTFHVVADGPTAQRTSVSIDAGLGAVPAGKGVRLEVSFDVPEGSTNRRVDVYAIPNGRWSSTVASGDVDSGGVFSTTVEPERNTTYVARWAGDAEYLPAVSTPVSVEVRTRTSTSLSRYAGRSGRWFVFGVNRPIVQTGRVFPASKGVKLGFEAQMVRDGRWRTVLRTKHRTNDAGVAGTALFASRPGRFRVRNVTPTTWAHVGSTSAWRYVLVRR